MHWRAAKGYFSYELDNNGLKGNQIKILLEEGKTETNFQVYFNNKLVDQPFKSIETQNGLLENIYNLPEDLKDSEKITVKFTAKNNSETSKVYEVRLVKDE